MKASYYLEKVREKAPLVHHLTNWVTIYDCANVVKIFGAAPVMAHALEEVADMTSISSSLVLNIGTLTTDFVDSMMTAAKSANKKGIPVTLDVCGAGATVFRDNMCLDILDHVKIDIVKGNSSEIARIAGLDVQTKGVDAGEVAADLGTVAGNLARQRHCTVVITGKTDICTDGETMLHVDNGCEMMTRVVGTGCMASSVIGTFAAVSKDLPEAAAAGLACYEIAAELASKKAAGPASFKEALLDEISKLDEKTVDRLQNIS
jgi:hydroxyethylthiazole kinase